MIFSCVKLDVNLVILNETKNLDNMKLSGFFGSFHSPLNDGYMYFRSPSGKSLGKVYWASLMRWRSIRLYQSFLITLLIWRFFHSLRITLYISGCLVGWISRNLSCSHSSIIQLFALCLSSILKGVESWMRYSFCIWNFGCSNWWTRDGVSVSKTNPRLSLSRRPM